MRRTHELSRLGHLSLHTFVKRNIKSLRRKKNQYTSVRKKIVYLRITNDNLRYRLTASTTKMKVLLANDGSKIAKDALECKSIQSSRLFSFKMVQTNSRPFSHRVPTEPSHGRQQTIHSTRR